MCGFHGFHGSEAQVQKRTIVTNYRARVLNVLGGSLYRLQLDVVVDVVDFDKEGNQCYGCFPFFGCGRVLSGISPDCV